MNGYWIDEATSLDLARERWNVLLGGPARGGKIMRMETMRSELIEAGLIVEDESINLTTEDWEQLVGTSKMQGELKKLTVKMTTPDSKVHHWSILGELGDKREFMLFGNKPWVPWWDRGLRFDDIFPPKNYQE